MRLLLDTHVLLWALGSPARLGTAVRETIEERSNDVFFSAASIWEIAIRAALGRSGLPVSPARIVAEVRATGFTELPVAHAIAEPMRLHTADGVLALFCEPVHLIGVDHARSTRA